MRNEIRPKWAIPLALVWLAGVPRAGADEPVVSLLMDEKPGPAASHGAEKLMAALRGGSNSLSANTYDNSTGAVDRALTKAIEADVSFRRLVEAWPRLPAHTQETILAIVDAVGGKRKSE
jgi:hypothetical protein